MLTTQTNKKKNLQRISLFGFVVIICNAFLYVVVLWAFAARVL